MSAYPGYKTRESFGYTHKEGWTVKGWERWMEYREALYAYWAAMAKRRYHALPEDKGIPVPHTGVRRNRRSWTHNGQSVSAGSHVLSHYYASEGDKGRWVRKVVRNRERALWLSEWQEEQNYDPYDAETVAQWFYDNTDDMDADVIPSVYTVGETVVEWPSDYYDEYGYDPGPYSVYDYVDFDPYDLEGYGSYCVYCDGECEL